MHVHLDHECYPKVAVLRGEVLAVPEFSKSVIAECGVTVGQMNIIPVIVHAEAHTH